MAKNEHGHDQPTSRGVDVTGLLARIARDDADALSELFEIVYSEVHAQASRTLRRLPRSETMNTTAAVHESYLKVFGENKTDLKSRQQFYFATTRAIRDVLVDYLRRKGAEKRGRGKRPIDIDEVEPSQENREEVVLFVHEAIEVMSQQDPICAKVVQLRFFGGLTHEEISDSLGISVPKARREWAYAKDWLARRLAD